MDLGLSQGMIKGFKPANLNRPSWQWSQRDWTIFKATCHHSERSTKLRLCVVIAYRSGVPVAKIVEPGKLSKWYVYLMLATQLEIDRIKMRRFYERRYNLGRPIDMGGPRDEWIERDIDDQMEGA